jgi:hypothetical protein
LSNLPEPGAQGQYTDGFHGRGYPEPDRDRAAEIATAKHLIARILRYRF